MTAKILKLPTGTLNLVTALDRVLALANTLANEQMKAGNVDPLDLDAVRMIDDAEVLAGPRSITLTRRAAEPVKL